MKRNIYLLALVSMICAVSSCKKEDSESGTKAVFSYVADGFKVNFTNFSTNATDYTWDFGDDSGETSTSKSPQHIFKKKGDFLVSLTAKNGAETSTFIDTVTIIGPNITINGDFSDWEYVSFTHENAAGTPGTLSGLKTFASATDIYFYLEGTPDMKVELFDMFIDADNNPATGYNIGAYPAGSGADFLLEGPPVKPGWGSVYKHTGGPNDFSFTPVATFDDAMNFSAIVTSGGKNIFEFSIKKSALGAPKGFVNFCFFDLSSGYAELGKLPGAPTAKFIAVPL